MRPLRLLLSLASCLTIVVVLSVFAASRTGTASSTRNPNGFGAYLSWHSPSSLFPPSAVISLTDDNSTFFLARPAAFGPLLPTKGLSGQIWIGSGFGDDGHGGIASAEGELGCSDVPGWSDGEYGSPAAAGPDAAQLQAAAAAVRNKNSAAPDFKASKRSVSDTQPDDPSSDARADGTDDHLHHPLAASPDPKTPSHHSSKPGHADIQSLQETAEIAGKVVLLSRGGCGFLEKVKWVQRRGGVALIVGDDIRGGPLVTMYARGPTSNVTIPSIFTSHTTAHLLSKLVPSGGFADEPTAREAQRLGLAAGDSAAVPDAKKQQGDQQNAKPGGGRGSRVSDDHHHHKDHDDDGSGSGSWIASMFSSPPSDKNHQDSRRPPSSGKIDWVLQANFEDEAPKKGTRSSTTAAAAARSVKSTKTPGSDEFVIGIHDWRDPDLLESQIDAAQTASSQSAKSAEHKSAVPHAGPKGGSITPGSGEYHNKPADSKSSKKSAKNQPGSGTGADDPDSWIGRVVGSHDSKTTASKSTKPPHVVALVDSKPPLDQASTGHAAGEDEPHDGLWVTLTPATMSSSPFFDTLLVLVVSPLVTLTIVYALLLLRSRIRRRRWRAPKSVVDRLPVRTYHTIASSASSGASDAATSPPRTPTAATPLLHSGARPISQPRARPRSRTVSEVPASGSSFTNTPSLEQVQEKREAGLAEWRRRYGGRQRECVICLEEYVDGVSRVMGLPCGHEFHADCITPWLTTRRRTCPICKGDVVRSLGRGNASASLSSPTAQPLLQRASHDHDDVDVDDVQEQTVNSQNLDPASNEPVSRDHEALEDLEQGVDLDRTR